MTKEQLIDEAIDKHIELETPERWLELDISNIEYAYLQGWI